MTEQRMRRLSAPNPTLSGGLLCAAGFALLAWPSLLAAAVGVELFAAGFWCWARAAEDRARQLPRWAWLRRPAAALWLAAGLQAVIGNAVLGVVAPLHTPTGAVARVEALAVLWAAFELMATFPLARSFSDRPGPLRATGPWLPVMLPAAGFLVLWRHAPHWTEVPEVCSVALVLLLLTALLAALRAFSRRQWQASLRWLAVYDCALAGVLVGLRVVPSDSALLLWIGAWAGHVLLLAGEMSGAAPRRSSARHRLWRVASWTPLASLSWPVIATLGFGPPGVADPVMALAAAGAVALAAWVSVQRLVEAPERRTMVRREAAIPLIQIGALSTLTAGPVALTIAWWSGFQPPLADSLASIMPAFAGGWTAALGVNLGLGRFATWFAALGNAPRRAAQMVFHGVVRFQRVMLSLLKRLALGVLAPARDLHTGDAQEFLLFVAGVAVLALVLPLLR